MDGAAADGLKPVAVEVELAQAGQMTQRSGLQIEDPVVSQVEAYQGLKSVEHRRSDVVELVACQLESAEVWQVGKDAVRNEAAPETQSVNVNRRCNSLWTILQTFDMLREIPLKKINLNGKLAEINSTDEARSRLQPDATRYGSEKQHLGLWL